MSRIPLGRFARIIPLTLMCLFGLLVLLTGGGARNDIQSLIILRPAAILLGAFAIWHLRGEQFATIRSVSILLLLLMLLMAIQLIPLPPELWSRLPGRTLLTEIFEAASLRQPWYPISLSPIRTWNSLFALTIPAATLLLFAGLPREHRYTLLPCLLSAGLVSAVMGLAQAVGPSRSALYFYEITNGESAVGIFSNRNHQAAFLACMLPMLAVYIGKMPGTRWRNTMVLGACALGLFFVVMILATSSRGGVLLVAAALLVSWAFNLWTIDDQRLPVRSGRVGPWLASGITVLLAIGVIVSSRAPSLLRLFRANEGDEIRLALIRPLLDMFMMYFPVGAGYGAFEGVYRVIEPLELTGSSYLNHAHNDLLEFAIEGGLPGLVLLFAFLTWWVRRAAQLWRDRGAGARGHVFSRLGAGVTALLMMGSLFDYPLRTPAIAMLFAIGCGWMGSGTMSRRSSILGRSDIQARG